MDFLRGPTFKGGGGGDGTDSTIIYISMREVIRMTSLSRSTIYRLIKKNEFPKPVRLSSGRIGFNKQDVLKWLRDRYKP